MFSKSSPHLLGGNCFFRFRDALRGSKLVDTSCEGDRERKLEDCSRSSEGFDGGSDVASSVKFRLASKQRVHIAGFDMRRRVRVN